MTLEFLSPTPDGEPPAEAPLAASPLQAQVEAAGASFEAREGWRVPAGFGSPEEELRACREGVAIADRSALGKLELQGRPLALAAMLQGLLGGGPPPLGTTAQLGALPELEGDAALDGAAAPPWAPVWLSSPDRALALCEPGETPRLRAVLQAAAGGSPDRGVVELTAGMAAFELRGPLARELLARLSAIDLRAERLPAGEVRAGLVAEVPATVLCVEPDALLVLVAAPEAPDAWEIAIDAGRPLGLRPVGERTRAELVPPPREVAARA